MRRNSDLELGGTSRCVEIVDRGLVGQSRCVEIVAWRSYKNAVVLDA